MDAPCSSPRARSTSTSSREWHTSRRSVIPAWPKVLSVLSRASFFLWTRSSLFEGRTEIWVAFKYNEGLHSRQSVLITFRDRRKTFLICKGLDTAKEFPEGNFLFNRVAKCSRERESHMRHREVPPISLNYAKHELRSLVKFTTCAICLALGCEVSVSSGPTRRFFNSRWTCQDSEV